MTDIKQLIERLAKAIEEVRRKPFPISDLIPLLASAKDALEAKSQPVGVEPVGYFCRHSNGDYSQVESIHADDLEAVPLYSSETVARLQASNEEKTE